MVLQKIPTFDEVKDWVNSSSITPSSVTTDTLEADEASVNGPLDAESATVAEQLGIPQYSDDTNAPNDTVFYNTETLEQKYKDKDGVVYVAEQRTDDEIAKFSKRYSEGLYPEFYG